MRPWRRLAVAIGIATAALVAACWPVSTFVGYNYQVTAKRLTLFEKAIAFIDRDLGMRRLTGEIAGVGGTSDQRLLRMFDWVVQNIHPLPEGLPIVDDHVFHIFVRRYGAIDQRAHALAALASYDGMPAAVVGLGRNPHRQFVQLTVVRLGGRFIALDVNNRVVFRKPSGELATLKDLIAQPSIIKTAGAEVMVDEVPYEQHFGRLGEIDLDFLYMEQQRIWPRLRNELGARFSLR